MSSKKNLLSPTQRFTRHYELALQAEQINRMTRLRRRALGYGEDPDIGLDATRRNAQALRRSVVAIQTNGSAGAQTHEARNGVGQAELATNIPPAPVVERPMREKLKQRAAGVSDDAFERQAARLEREEQRAARAGRNVLEVKED